MKPLPKSLCILGVTGIGKSAIAGKVAQLLNGKVELISLDSVKVKKGLDIGSHKVYAKGLKMHMYDVVDIDEEYTAVQYVNMATKCTQEILDRGNVPIIFGGNGMYLSWYLFGCGGVFSNRRKVYEIEDHLVSLEVRKDGGNGFFSFHVCLIVLGESHGIRDGTRSVAKHRKDSTK